MKFVRDLMTKDVLTVHTQQKLSEVSVLFRENNIHHVPVLEGNKPVGIITSSDLYKLVFDIENIDERMVDAMLDHQFDIAEVMSKEIATIAPDDKIKEAAGKLATGALHSLVVVDAAGEMVGILTSTDLLRFLHEEL